MLSSRSAATCVRTLARTRYRPARMDPGRPGVTYVMDERASAIPLPALNDRAAFTAAISPHYDHLVRRLMVILHDTEEARDVAQSAVMRAFEHRHRFDGSDVRAWQTAETTALAKIRSFDPAVENLTVESVQQVAQVSSVSGPSQRIAEFPEAVDAWVFFVRGTSDEWLSTTGWALIDADSGEVILADLLHTNDPVTP